LWTVLFGSSTVDRSAGMVITERDRHGSCARIVAAASRPVAAPMVSGS
jgi:hypothetical protein